VLSGSVLVPVQGHTENMTLSQIIESAWMA
jgi:hypothetical protein